LQLFGLPALLFYASGAWVKSYESAITLPKVTGGPAAMVCCHKRHLPAKPSYESGTRRRTRPDQAALSRSEAIRRLIEIALTANPNCKVTAAIKKTTAAHVLQN
jgi:hypothetical protein